VVPGITVGALRRLAEYPWPGNVRELEHTVQRLVCLSPTGEAIVTARVEEILSSAGIGGEGGTAPSTAAPPGAPPGAHPGPYPPPRRGPLDPAGLECLDLAMLERQTIIEALQRCDGHQGKAAELLGISRTALYRRVRRFGLEPVGSG